MGANAKVNQNSESSRQARCGPLDKAYFFPDPGLFVGAEHEWKSAAYLKQWEHIKDVWMLRASSSHAKPCLPQEWRNILSLPFVAPKEDANSATSESFAKVRELIGECLSTAGLSVRSLAFTLEEGECVDGLQVDVQRAKVLLWELSELNFRWELRALDRRLLPGSEPLQRLKLLTHCFPQGEEGLISIDSCRATIGLADPTFAGRLPYLQSLWTVMDDWPVSKPSSWKVCPAPAASPSGDKWERDVTQFYAQTFFDYFGRPAILPRSL
jgi:hypothetical protein